MSAIKRSKSPKQKPRKKCKSGKSRSRKTGRCRKTPLRKKCKSGKTRSRKTGRCRKTPARKSRSSSSSKSKTPKRKSPKRKSPKSKSPNKPKLTETQFYCVKCRCTVKLQEKEIRVHTYKNKKFVGGKPALVGVCKCNTNVTKFIKQADKKTLQDKYGKK